MEPLRVLILEDEPFVSMELEDIVTATVPSVVVVKSSVAGAREALQNAFNLALLDVDVTNGKTYDIAKLLGRKQVPYVFVSGSDKLELPDELQSAPFIRKPFATSQIRNVVLSADRGRGEETEEAMTKEDATADPKAKLKDLVGLPPGDHTPHGKGAKLEPDTTPDGGLTAPDTEGLNPHAGTGLQVER